MKQSDDDVRAFLAGWRTPPADPAAKADLLRALQAVPLMPLRPSPRLSLTWAALIARSQFRLVHPALWIVSALILALGGMVTLILYHPAQTGRDLPFALIAPLVAALGVAFLYGGENDPPLELQLSTPVSPRAILLARLALVFGFNLLIGAAGSVALAFAQSSISLVPLIMAWLAPMTALSALAFLMSVLLFDSLVSVLISMALWATQIVRRFDTTIPALHALPDLLRADLYPLMFIAAAASVALALWLAEREQRWSHT